MNRELLIAFVYDTQRCTQEADDPQEAVLFFHPGWVSEQQRLALCGQLMGATYFLLATFSPPRILSLQSGKFAIRAFGRYIVAIGTDRNIPEWVLEQRAETMASLLRLYFGDLETLASQCKEKVSEQGATFSERLGRIFETFLPIIQYAGQIIGNVPTVHLPKSASKLFLEAMQILHSCQEKQGVLGGAVLYQNKVVASQLSADVTKQLVLSDPYRIKSPGTNVNTSYHLPLGAQLLQVFIAQREYHSLKRDAEQVRGTYSDVDKAPKVPNRKSMDSVSSLRGEKARIFTVFEEDNELEGTYFSSNQSSTIESCILENDVESLLDSCLVKDEKPSVEKGSRFICGTPMRDLNVSKILHEQAVSICSRTEKAEKRMVADVADNNKVSDISTVIPDVVRDAVAVTALCNKQELFTTSPEPSSSVKMFQAVHDLHAFLMDHSPHKSLSLSLPSINTNNVPMRYYSLGLPFPTNEQCSPQHARRYFYNTITDPCFPVFRNDGLPLSRCLFDQHIAKHYEQLHHKPSVNGEAKIKQKTALSKSVQKSSATPLLPVKSQKTPDIASTSSEILPQPKKRPISLSLKIVSSLNQQPINESMNESPKNDAQLSRPTSLAGVGSSRPSSLSSTGTSRPTSLPGPLINPVLSDDRKRQAQESLPPVARPTSLSSGLPLTPLMAKLSHLAMDRHSTIGTPVSDRTPCDLRDPIRPTRVETPMVPFAKPLPRLSQSDIDDFPVEGNEETVLLVCGLQSMTLVLLMECECAASAELLKSLWEIAASSLESLETSLNHSLDQIPNSSNSGTDSYSFLCIDPAWDAVHKGGAWSGPELELVGSLHRDFKENQSLTEICVRVHDTLVYGNQCGQREVFYQQQQPGQGSVGLPTPADLMGTVPLKARRRLERDHGILLL